MPEGLRNLLARVQELWTGLDNTKKIAIGGVLAAIIIAFVAMAGYSSTPAKEILYDDLSASDYAAISKSLDTMGVPWSGSGTSTIFVDGKRRQEVITKLAQDNLIPAGVEGWNLFNMSRWDETTFDKYVKLHRA